MFLFIFIPISLLILYTSYNLTHMVKGKVYKISLFILVVAFSIYSMYIFMAKDENTSGLLVLISNYLEFFFIPIAGILFILRDLIILILFRKRILLTCTSYVIVIFMICAGIYGTYHAKDTKIVPLTLDFNLKHPLKVVVVSDTHINGYFDKKRINRIVDQINSLSPDVVLLAGDIVDDAKIKPIIKSGNLEYIRNLKATYGVYGINGNHEYYGDNKSTVEYIKSLGVKLIIDDVVDINKQISVLGRDSFHGKRKKLDDILGMRKTNLPLIYLSHNPQSSDIKAVTKTPAKFAIFGHTHNGQYIPFKWIVGLKYAQAYGLRSYVRENNKTNPLQVYVTSGVGTWGPPIRIGTQSEIVEINIK